MEINPERDKGLKALFSHFNKFHRLIGVSLNIPLVLFGEALSRENGKIIMCFRDFVTKTIA